MIRPSRASTLRRELAPTPQREADHLRGDALQPQGRAVLSAVRLRREQRRSALRKLGFTSYDEYLRSPQWRALKARYRASENPQDCICGETDGLQLHHLTYERVGREDLADLTPLCKRCHAIVHELERRGEIGLDFEGLVDDERAAFYALAERARHQAHFAEADRERAERDAKRHERSLCNELRVTLGEALRRGADVSEEVAEIRAITAELRQV